jgi:hypothetical protein
MLAHASRLSELLQPLALAQLRAWAAGIFVDKPHLSTPIAKWCLKSLIIFGFVLPKFASFARVQSLNFQLLAEDLYILTTGATGLGTLRGPDPRVANALNLPNLPFQLTGATLSYDSCSGISEHRFYQMWQPSNKMGGKSPRKTFLGIFLDSYK